ncbi:hypothetical protein [Azonexus sp. IMCC34839]|uniref:hypothetical protein n=1 Tax=Azonexus sp. IMCC34839 TaxID=3133695 RepID=UPI0039995B23
MIIYRAFKIQVFTNTYHHATSLNETEFVVIDLISGILSNLSAAKSIGDGLVDLRDANVVASVKADLTERILNAQAHLSQVLASIIEKDARIAELESRCRELEKEKLDRSRYELRELAPGRGVFAYALKPDNELVEHRSEVPHLVCQPCLDIRAFHHAASFA